MTRPSSRRGGSPGRASTRVPTTGDGVSRAAADPPPAAGPTEPTPPATVSAEERRVRAMLGKTLPGVVYGMALTSTFGKACESNGIAFAIDAIERMEPRDAVEEMLLAQLLFAHARAVRLTALANEQTSLDGIRVVNEYADRASNTYRRLLLALAEYRRPALPGGNVSVVQQTNIAGQQVFQNHEPARTIATNELGWRPPELDRLDAEGPPPLSPDAARPGGPSPVDRSGESLDPVYRPPLAGREGPLEDERDEAR